MTNKMLESVDTVYIHTQYNSKEIKNKAMKIAFIKNIYKTDQLII